jgi:hypothetical protein
MKRPPLNDCGCCEGVEPVTPAPIQNRPGLRAIAYRCGTHAQFKETMLAALSSSAHPALSGLATRDNDDFSIALLDAWATTAGVLSFYQERIAQESFLRTATERRSLLELGRLIGYELRSGVAASTHLAFTMETAPGSPPATTIEIGTKVQSVPGPNEKPQLFETVEKIEARPEWNEIPAQQTIPQRIQADTTVIYLAGTDSNLRKGDTLLFLAAEKPGVTRPWDLCRVAAVDLDSVKKRTRVALASRPMQFTGQSGEEVQVFAMRQRASLFGYNAPDRRMLPAETLLKFDEKPPEPSLAIAPRSSLARTSRLELGPIHELDEGPPDWPFTLGNTVDLDSTYPAITAGSWVALVPPAGLRALARVTAAAEAGRVDYALTGKVARLSVALTASPGVDLDTFSRGAYRGTVVLGDSQELALAEAPVPPIISGSSLVVAQRLDTVRAGRVLAISGRRAIANTPWSGVVTLASVELADTSTTITFAPALPELQVETLRVNANVALATHGETVAEVLGSGDASTPFQRFVLRQPPLTYVRSSAAGGATSTLLVRVDDVLWHEVPTLYGCGPAERVYVTRTSEEGLTTVQFGDGVTGARLPTGQENVRATYRRGIGLEGLVKTDQLSLLLTRPLGLKGVTNPVPGRNAADREQLSDARRNASLSILTLDRIVSLQDHEDFVRAFSGVAKAFATWTWDGDKRGVFITIAGGGGDEIDLDGDFGRSLDAAIRDASVPGVPVRVQSYRKAAGAFTLSARVKIDPDHETERVLAAVRVALELAFSFEAREFGQPVELSEVIAVIHSVSGVTAVDVDDLRRVPSEPAVPVTLLAPRARSLQQLALRRFGLFASEMPRVTPLLKRPVRVVHPPSRLIAAVPQAGARGVVSPAELLVLSPLNAEQIGVMP